MNHGYDMVSFLLQLFGDLEVKSVLHSDAMFDMRRLGGFGLVDKAFEGVYSCHQPFTTYYLIPLGLKLLT